MIVNYIGKLAREQGSNSSTLANRAGIAYNTAYGLFMGRFTRIDLTTLNRIYEVFQVQPGQLLECVPDEVKVAGTIPDKELIS